MVSHAAGSDDERRMPSMVTLTVTALAADQPTQKILAVFVDLFIMLFLSNDPKISDIISPKFTI